MVSRTNVLNYRWSTSWTICFPTGFKCHFEKAQQSRFCQQPISKFSNSDGEVEVVVHLPWTISKSVSGFSCQSSGTKGCITQECECCRNIGVSRCLTTNHF